MQACHTCRCQPAPAQPDAALPLAGQPAAAPFPRQRHACVVKPARRRRCAIKRGRGQEQQACPALTREGLGGGLQGLSGRLHARRSWSSPRKSRRACSQSERCWLCVRDTPAAGRPWVDHILPHRRRLPPQRTAATPRGLAAFPKCMLMLSATATSNVQFEENAQFVCSDQHSHAASNAQPLAACVAAAGELAAATWHGFA